MKPLLVLTCLAWVCLSASPLHAQQGIASKYVADVGIANDPEVVFSQDFETGTLSQILALFNSVSNPQGMSLNSNVPPGSRGTRALQITSIGGQNTGADLYKKLSQGYQQLYLRYYIRYSGGGGAYHHTGGAIGGYNPPTDFPQGNAGVIPNGSNFFYDMVQTDILAANPLRVEHYAHWPGMQCCFGNYLMNDPTVVFISDTWTCVELMIKMNSPLTSLNGEVAIWINGTKVSHLGPGFPNGIFSGGRFTPAPNGIPFPGFLWRSTSNLSLNWMWFLHYVEQDPSGYVGRVWLDHIVLATSHIGPMNLAPTDVVPPAPPTNLQVQ